MTLLLQPAFSDSLTGAAIAQPLPSTDCLGHLVIAARYGVYMTIRSLVCKVNFITYDARQTSVMTANGADYVQDIVIPLMVCSTIRRMLVLYRPKEPVCVWLWK